MLARSYECVFYESAVGKAPVEKFIESLDEGTQDKFFFKKELLECFGARLRHPHTELLGNGLYELRFTGKEGQIRVLFFFFLERQIVLLHGFVKKSQKTPKKEIRTAYQRMKEYLSRTQR